MNAQEINLTFDLVTYVSGIVTLHKSGAYYYGPCPICGGTDRFQIKRNHGDVWICRKCKPDKYNSVIDFLMSYHKEDFKAALQRAGGTVQAPRRELGTGKPVQPPAPLQVLPSDEWQREAWRKIDAANNLLIGDPAGEPAARYLYSRGIDKASIYASHLGYDPAKYDPITKAQRPAILIPWLDLGDIVTAVKYRFIDELASQDHHKRFLMMRGSMPYLFGLRDIRAKDDTLLFVEGEVNCISVLQTHPAGVSVVSGGSEGNGNASILQALARNYSRVVIWTDNPAKGGIIRDRMNQPTAKLLRSPVKDGKKYDANQMLQEGLLADFLTAALSVQCERVQLNPAAAHYLEKATVLHGGG